MADLNPLKPTIQCCLQPGAYLGEISALCLLPRSPCPFLLAGSGSEILIYDIKAGSLLKSFHVFQGIRVHGMSIRLKSQNGDSVIVVFGEKKVKLFGLRFDGKGRVEVKLLSDLPRFDQWVLDACFLEEDNLLAIGLSDNSVALCDMDSLNAVYRVKYPERCLLYSMRVWGDGIESLLVASGTIYNEIIVWKLSPHRILLPSSAHFMESTNQCTSGHSEMQIHGLRYSPIHVSRLIGHEGSIFRIAWSSDGSRLMSVSDDRSARIWKTSGLNQPCGDLVGSHGSQFSVDLVLFGHSARIWDCHISDSIVITAGEDCTCRVWGMDGKQLSTVKEHIGRGIWRCLYDPGSSILITAGFDSAIKVHLLRSSSLRELRVDNGGLNDLKNQTEVFTICAPKVANSNGLMDSKSEYVRCLRFTQENMLYVATNNGYLYHVELRHDGGAIWTEVSRVSKESPIICMDLITVKSSVAAEDTVAVGDGKGNVTAIRVVSGDTIPKSAVSCTWPAEKERQLLGIYWCKSLGCGHLFTADPRGVLKLWNIGATLQSNADNTNMGQVYLVAIFASSFGARIMCLDASIKEEVLVCGDQRGNLIVYPMLKSLIDDNSSKLVEKIPILSQFKGAHGISAVTSTLIATLNLYQVEVHTTGGDGCICHFKYNKNVRNLEFIGMKQVKELSTIQSIPTKSTSEESSAQGNYAVGFMSADFIIWNLTNESKTVQVPCGGWRRPHSYYLGDVPEYQNCFAYLKDNDIHIHRLWVLMHRRQLIPKVLHVQYHGRETHSLCFISCGMQSNSMKNCYSWLATGCEDGTVRLTRYTHVDMGSWCESKLLGEHVGGSAVRSIYFVSEIHTIVASQSCSSIHALSSRNDDQFLLISVGAKQVLTSWLLQHSRADSEKLHLNCSNTDCVHMSSPANGFPSISFQWLSTHMPPKFASAHRKARKLEITENGNSSSMKSSLSGSDLVEYKKQHLKPNVVDQCENDWRYMAVTAFLVKLADSMLTVCFVVVACSDATLMLRALLLPYRLWVDVAELFSQTSPVLALQHLVIPSCKQPNGKFTCNADHCMVGFEKRSCKDMSLPFIIPRKYNVRTRNAYIIISGSTDGCITFWDLSETIENFMQRTLELKLEMLIDGQRRPQTGRGSQGGRWWKSLIQNQSSQKNVGDSSIIPEVGNSMDERSTEKVSVDASTHTSSNTSLDVHEIRPLHVLNSVHKSGVNCLHVSVKKDCLQSESEMIYCILSGGDDQAVHYIAFDLAWSKNNSCSHLRRSSESGSFICIEKCSNQRLNGHYQLRVLYQDRVDSAHSSAVKGIWTDGIWVFSTGLDQRIRCWKIDIYGKLTERAHLMVSVPEPEALDAIKLQCDSKGERERYQIAVAGRGMQMAEFDASIEED